jgi:hypothetical protein
MTQSTQKLELLKPGGGALVDSGPRFGCRHAGVGYGATPATHQGRLESKIGRNTNHDPQLTWFARGSSC